MKSGQHREFEYMEWEFLSLTMYKFSFKDRHVQWILASITSISMVVLINGESFEIIKTHRGLRKGCALSPLFLYWLWKPLVEESRLNLMEGLSWGAISLEAISFPT